MVCARWKDGLIRVVGGLSLAAISAPAQADLVSVQAARDNTLYQDAAGALSNGAGSFFFAGVTAQGLTRRGLIAFDLAGAIPAGAKISAVTLTLHVSQTAAGELPVAVHRALANWGEGASDAPATESGGAPAALGDATWLHTFFDTQMWSTPGGDFEAAASASASVGGVGFYDWTGPGLLADVQGWLANPTGNFGWVIRGSEVAALTIKRFDTRESETGNFRPVLVIEYTAVPAPAAGALLVLASLVGRGRGR